MDKTLALYEHILREYLSAYFDKQQNINPVELNRERFATKALFIATIFFLKNHSGKTPTKLVQEANDWLKTQFAQENLLSTLIDSVNPLLIHLVNKHFSEIDTTDVLSLDISTFYETLLGIETGNENNLVEISTGKNYRNKLGSYYTPSELAKSITQKTIDTFFTSNFGINKLSTANHVDAAILKEISSISFVDFSCGGGNFLIEILKYFEQVANNLNVTAEEKLQILRSVAKNISAFDVDCLALEVAKLNLLLSTGLHHAYATVSENFIHGNFLLQSTFPIDEKKKIEIFSSGFIYHEALSIFKEKVSKYDVILGNPPWEKIRFEEKKFYALYATSISNNHFKESRIEEIKTTIENNTHLAAFSQNFQSEIENAKSDIKKNPVFNLSNNGELNTYALFTDIAIKSKTQRGIIGLVLKSAIVTSQINKTLFQYLTKEQLIIAIYDFINRKKIFAIDSRERFCFLLLGKTTKSTFDVAMNLVQVSAIHSIKSNVSISHQDLKMLNPLTGMLPNFSTKEEIRFLLRTSNEFPFFGQIYTKVRFGRIVHLTSHATFITKKQSATNTPVYEGKFFNQFNGRYSGFNNVPEELRYGSKSSSAVLSEIAANGRADYPESRFFIDTEKWIQLSKNHTESFMLAWRSLTSASNTRTCIATILPFIPALQSVQFLTTSPHDLLYLCGMFNAVTFDFILKKKLSGIDLTQSVINQMPVPEVEKTAIVIPFDGRNLSIKDHISLLVFSLLDDDIRLKPLFEILHLQAPVEESRASLIRKVDLFFMSLYGLSESELTLVLSEFSKQYTREDLEWFKTNLNALNKTISSAGSSISHLTPG
ncbi:Eco57I restriction-modification methylase domain-containing protein [Chitinophaga pinensis]|uniref:site-specific DNA-methyltransferase (adenine-specific) n=1 Tax=Chitinophaga pinensis (strain ATCC 43595 / DSM 2588 / LMG 13176 / NBRC 15968 / NCIMB 11800 / UQM 2034) TaxID=485918 RepID=A0A979FZS0_CHIPD|nr:DNA methyltransferase [Chitinophaga pinensis]ACU58082.1 hypothetical protein Cpin_0584 [Chitinophaga pinensis DSM 2588]